MKLKESLAKEYCDPKFISEFEGYDLSPEEAYLAGFEKARKMLADSMDTGNPLTEPGINWIRNFGEEEV